MNSSLKKRVNLHELLRFFLPKHEIDGEAQPSKRFFAPPAKKGSVAQPSKRIFAPPAKKGSVAQLYSALDFGSSGWGLESLQGHKKNPAR